METKIFSNKSKLIKLGWIVFWLYFILTNAFNLFTNISSYEKVGPQEDWCIDKNVK